MHAHQSPARSQQRNTFSQQQLDAGARAASSGLQPLRGHHHAQALKQVELLGAAWQGGKSFGRPAGRADRDVREGDSSATLRFLRIIQPVPYPNLKKQSPKEKLSLSSLQVMSSEEAAPKPAEAGKTVSTREYHMQRRPRQGFLARFLLPRSPRSCSCGLCWRSQQRQVYCYGRHGRPDHRVQCRGNVQVVRRHGPQGGAPARRLRCVAQQETSTLPSPLRPCCLRLCPHPAPYRVQRTALSGRP